MKTLKNWILTAFLLFPIVALLGCASASPGGGSGGASNSPLPSLDCENARKLYTAYLATMLVREVSQKEIQDAKDAGTFLSIWCGWTPPPTPGGKRRPTGAPTDRNGVPVLVEPQAFRPMASLETVAPPGVMLTPCHGCMAFDQTLEIRPGVEYGTVYTLATDHSILE